MILWNGLALFQRAILLKQGDNFLLFYWNKKLWEGVSKALNFDWTLLSWINLQGLANIKSPLFLVSLIQKAVQVNRQFSIDFPVFGIKLYISSG